ncbi:hypothetical protein RRG08_023488 [Elysia crispata]|uniref:Uncharacterized protein n=1 Tax=Elysia crispata TaxID=231223 RepID=A0AAE0YY61_9GAST|nr:hypothetical protein RRG08_023488 [Elysia crispata]
MSDPIVLPGFEPEEFPSTDFVRITIPPLPLLYVEVMILGCLLNLPAWRAAMLLVSAGACFNELDLPQSPASCGVPRWRAALVELHGSPAKEISL